MEIKVRVFLDDNLIDQLDFAKVCIKNPNVDRVINDIIKRNNNLDSATTDEA